MIFPIGVAPFYFRDSQFQFRESPDSCNWAYSYHGIVMAWGDLPLLRLAEVTLVLPELGLNIQAQGRICSKVILQFCFMKGDERGPLSS